MSLFSCHHSKYQFCIFRKINSFYVDNKMLSKTSRRKCNEKKHMLILILFLISFAKSYHFKALNYLELVNIVLS